MPAQVFGAAAAIATAAVIVTSVFVESAGSVAGENPVVTLVPFSVMFDAGQAPTSMTGTVWGEPLPIWSLNPARGTSTRSGFELMGYSTFDGVTIPS